MGFPGFAVHVAHASHGAARAARRAAGPVLAALCILAPAPRAAAQAPGAGEIDSSSGESSLSRSGLFASPVKAGAVLLSGDRLRTGSDGRIQFRLRDGSAFSLGPGTDFTIAAFRMEPARERAFFEMARGLVRTVSGLIGKRDQDAWRLTTPTAVMGIRGTEFTVEEGVCLGGACSSGERPGLRVSVHEGRVAVSNAGGTVEVPRGATLFVGDRSQPGRFVSGTGTPARPASRSGTAAARVAPARADDAAPARAAPKPPADASAERLVPPRRPAAATPQPGASATPPARTARPTTVMDFKPR